MNLSESISTCMGKYVIFKGRASRSEYWWFFLFTLIIGLGADLVTVAVYNIGDPTGQILSLIIYLIFLLPSIAVATRRLHDTGRTGWWQLLYFTIIGGILVIVWLATNTKNEKIVYNIT